MRRLGLAILCACGSPVPEVTSDADALAACHDKPALEIQQDAAACTQSCEACIAAVKAKIAAYNARCAP